ncbi:uncharacterized protein LOC121761575 [Salvia splendens]|uniref:uncharacterized protein LOC121761575 n=1 Tax=Salvia splendens TaxID=180675 RepID=UPI001C25C0F5|nr:uncharacterized protein LOC121761575 [Salvia splendens]
MGRERSATTMERNDEKQAVISPGMKVAKEEDMRKSLFSAAKSPTETGRPSSMVYKKDHRVIPAHIVAEAISTLHGLDLRWSGPITPTEMQYVEQYVVAKYQEYCNALVEGGEKTDLYDLCIKENLKNLSQMTSGNHQEEFPETPLEAASLISRIHSWSHRDCSASSPKSPLSSGALSQFLKFKLETRF